MYPWEGVLQGYFRVFAFQHSRDPVRRRLRSDSLNEVDRALVMPIVAGMGMDFVAFYSSSQW
jgi:hypothetical protein